jgi:hypothetical protein
MTSDKK